MRREPFSILLAGAQGQVGREIAFIAKAKGITMHAFDRQGLDISNATAVDTKISEIRPNLIINAAAYTAVDKAEEEVDKAYTVNRDGAKHLAQACAQYDIPLLHISTDYVFDGSKPDPYKEDDPVAPLGEYGKSKWQGEESIRQQLKQHIILRVAWVFGSHGHNFVKTMLRFGKERNELRVVDDQHGGPTPARYIAETLIILAEKYRDSRKLEWGTYHYCGTPATTWYGFSEEIFSQSHRLGMLDKLVKVIPISTREYPTPARRPANSILECAKLRTTFGIQQPDWRIALKQVLAEIQKG